MSSESKKIIAIVGATGHQGFSVAKAFSKLPNWHIRAITRNPSSEKAKELSSTLGCEVVQADLDDQASLSRAFTGAHAIFVNTDFWATYGALIRSGVDFDASAKAGLETELRHGKHAAAAAATPAVMETLERFVYSALGPMNRASGGKYPTSYHWEAKAAIVDHIESEQPELAKRTSIIYLGAYATNALLFPKPDPATGEYKIVIPCSGSTRFPITDEDNSTGVFVRALIEDEEPGTKLLAYDSYLTIDECIDIWSRATGKPARCESVTLEQMHERTGIPYEILWAPAHIEEFGYMAGIDNFIEPHQLKKKVTTPSWEDWVKSRDMSELLSREIVI
ncbi:NAD(P)-binding protein [Xylariaceae sp. FL0594]|nr:NAD(P)-binding protein [Xylariaceae sp. FL0594]